MSHFNLQRVARTFSSRERQHGQALVYGIFMLIGSLTALFFLFNTGQLSSEKTQLVNTADAVAYSAGVMHARALNFDAYNNRALVADEVLIAQLVSLSSWVQYARMHVEQVPRVFPECVSLYGAVYSAFFNFDPIYGAMCYILAYPGNPTALVVGQLETVVAAASQQAVTLAEGNKLSIKAAQAFLHAPAYFQAMRARVMQDVADRNYAGDGTVSVEPVVSSQNTGNGPVRDVYDAFINKYDDADRQRFADVAAEAAASDRFVSDRRWKSEGFPLIFSLCALHTNSVERRGGTNLIGLDEWKAEDTESAWQWHWSGGLFGGCKKSETPIAYGEQRDFPNGSEQDASGAKLGDSPRDNPAAHRRASSAAWNNYTGIPAFYDLAKAPHDSSDPLLRFAVRVVRSKQGVRTSDGASAVRQSPRINHFVTNFAGGEMAAMATSEVYFERPWYNTGDDSFTTGKSEQVVTQNQSLKNQAGIDAGGPGTRELGSLFNPYWQVRLAPNDADDLRSLQVRQGLTQ